MHSISHLSEETLVNTHLWLVSILKRTDCQLSEETQLQLRKTITNQEAYSLETQLLIAQVAKKYYWMLEVPNKRVESPSKKIEAEWLKAAFLSHPDQRYLELFDPFTINVLKSMLSDQTRPTERMVESLANSKLYLHQKIAIQFLKKALVKSFFKFEAAKKIIDILLHSRNDAIVMGTITVIADFPMIYKTFPEKEFWLLSKRSEAIQKAFFTVLKYWGDNVLFARVIEGDSWSIGLKAVMIERIAAYPSVEYTQLLFKLLNKYPLELGSSIIQVLYRYKLNGIDFSQKKQHQLLSFWATYRGMTAQKISELIRDLNEGHLAKFCFDENVEWYLVIDLLEALNTAVAKKILIQFFRNNKNQPVHESILNAFIKMNCTEAEDDIIAQFDSFPGQSTNALYFLGGEKTQNYFKDKLGFNAPANEKVDYYHWEVEAVRFLVERTPESNQHLAQLKAWNVPYLNQILTRINPKVDAAFFDAITGKDLEEEHSHELKSIINKLVEFKDARGLALFKQLILLSDENVREYAFLGLKKLIGNLYDDRNLTRRQLLFFDRETAVLSCQTTIVLEVLTNQVLDFTKQEIILNYLLKEADEVQVLEQLPELFSIGNLHIEKLVIQLVGNLNSEYTYCFLIPYLNLNQDIFRLRQALIAAKKSGSSLFESKIVELLVHRNMNVKKAAVDYCEKAGNFLSIKPLFNILKTNDNSGLRNAATSALKSILGERYFTYLFNHLLHSKTKREKDLLRLSFNDEEIDKAIWICEQESKRELITLFDREKKFQSKENAPFNKNKIDAVIEQLKQVTKDSLMQSKIVESINELNEIEVIPVLSELRLLLAELGRPIEFLLKVFYDHGGVISEDIAYKGISLSVPSISKWAAAELVQHKASYTESLSLGFSDTDLQIAIDYFYALEKKPILDWMDEHPRKVTHANLIPQYEAWEYKVLISDTLGFLDLKPSAIKQLKFFDRKLFNSLVFDELKKQQQADFIFSLDEDAILNMSYHVHSLYGHLASADKLSFLKLAATRPEFGFLTNQEKYLLVKKGWKRFSVKELSYTNHQVLRRELMKLLNLNGEDFFERREELKRRLNHFKNDSEILNRLIRKLDDAGLLFHEDFTDLKEFLRGTDSKVLWNIIYPLLSAGNYPLLNLIKRHESIHAEVLNLLDDWNLDQNMALLKWLNSYQAKVIYFPNLFPQLVREEEHEEYVVTGVQLMFKLCRYDPSYNQSTFEFIENQTLNKGEARQGLLLDLILENAPHHFLSALNTRKLLLKCDSNEDLKFKAAGCILKAINWNNVSDKHFLLDYLRNPNNTLTSEWIAELADSIEALENGAQLEIYSALLDIPPLSQKANEGLMKLFSVDYEIITLLSVAKRKGFFEDLKRQLVSINEEAFLRSIIKSMSLYEIDGYTDQIENLLHNHRSSKIRSLCLRELKKHLKKPAYLKVCKSLLDHKDIGILRQVIKALSFAKELDIIPRLLPLLESKKTQFNSLATEAILLFDQLAIPYLKKELNKCRPDKRKGIELLINKIERKV
jgi:HEAT repeat protein